MGTFEFIKRVNVDGTKNVMDAAKVAGATVFVATSSASIAHRNAGYWGNPFRRWPKNYFQAIDESDFDKPLPPHSEFFSNYAHTKAIAERMVCQANSPNFRTGTIRPANAIYGSSNGDQVVGESSTYPPSYTNPPTCCTSSLSLGLSLSFIVLQESNRKRGNVLIPV